MVVCRRAAPWRRREHVAEIHHGPDASFFALSLGLLCAEFIDTYDALPVKYYSSRIAVRVDPRYQATRHGSRNGNGPTYGALATAGL